jgi:hypothetical protein
MVTIGNSGAIIIASESEAMTGNSSPFSVQNRYGLDAVDKLRSLDDKPAGRS